MNVHESGSIPSKLCTGNGLGVTHVLELTHVNPIVRSTLSAEKGPCDTQERLLSIDAESAEGKSFASLSLPRALTFLQQVLTRCMGRLR